MPSHINAHDLNSELLSTLLIGHLTLRSTRTPPGSSSALSLHFGSSAPLVASVQAGPVNSEVFGRPTRDETLASQETGREKTVVGPNRVGGALAINVFLVQRSHPAHARPLSPPEDLGDGTAIRESGR